MDTTSNNKAPSPQHENIDPELNIKDIDLDSIRSESLTVKTESPEATTSWIKQTAENAAIKVIESLSNSEKFAQLAREARNRTR